MYFITTEYLELGKFWLPVHCGHKGMWTQSDRTNSSGNCSMQKKDCSFQSRVSGSDIHIALPWLQMLLLLLLLLWQLLLG